MKAALVAVIVAALAAAGLAASSQSSTRTTSAQSTASQAMFSPPRALVSYGHIRSLVRKGARYQLRFDPAYWLGGETANRAAVEDGVIAPGEAVPNDYYIRDESKRVLTYRVHPGARVTVVTNPSTGLRSTRITVAELAQILRGKNPRHRPLFGPTLGFWISATTDTVRSLDQQYQP